MTNTTSNAPKMSRRHYQFIADNISPLLDWPSGLQDMADILSSTNDNFDRDIFLKRATAAWEANQ